MVVSACKAKESVRAEQMIGCGREERIEEPRA